MSNPNDPGLPPNDPPPNGGPRNGGRYGKPAYRTGAARSDAVPMMEYSRVTEADLNGRAVMEKAGLRLVVAAGASGADSA